MTDHLRTRMAEYQAAVVAKILPVNPFAAGLQAAGQTFHPGSPTAILRARLILEEAQELADALKFGTLEEVVKEAADLQIVLTGTVVTYDLPADAAFGVVMNDNFARLEASTEVRPDGKIVKPKGWTKAILKDLI